MIIIWGSRGRIKKEALIQFNCVICNYNEILVYSIRRWFTFFFIPLFPIGRKKYYLECSSCENSYTLKDSAIIENLVQEQESLPNEAQL